MDNNQVIKWSIVTDVSNAMQGFTALHEKIKAIQEASAGLGGPKKFDDAPLKTFANSYSRTISDMTRQAEGFYKTFQQQPGNIEALAQYKALIPQIQQLTKEQEGFTKSIKGSGGALGAIGQEFSKHWGWMLTGIGTASAVQGIISAVEDISKLEQEFQQLKTVMPELEDNQATYNAAIKDSFALAEKYGTKIEQVTESLRLMGRGYHELSESEKLSEVALKLGVADNFDPQTATKAIESVIGAYGKQSEAVTFATKVMDSMTKVSHTSQVSANDLAESLMRSAAAAKAVGVGFDELNAMTAVIARNTGLSGQTIGDGLKSILNSIHTPKALAELKEMGVEAYKIGTDGTKEFRKISDVLLDVSIKAKGTNENLEAVFKQLSGGKFQVTKLSALLGDPNEYLRVLGNSINSSGFTDKQLDIQMDTIKRKAETLKASFEELLTTGGNESGFKNSLKSILDTLNTILKGLNNMNPLVWDAVGGITKLAAAFVVLRTAVNFASASYGLLRGAIVTTTGAQEALNVATVANPWGALAKLIVLAGSALVTYAYFAGEAASTQEKANAAADNAITAKSSEIEMMKQQTDFMETLGNSYVELQGALAKVGDDETKATEIKRTMGTVTEQLTAIVGKEAADRILASDDIQGAITQEQKVHAEKTEQMQGELNTLRTTQAKLANDTISMCNERIGAINAEADAFDIAATNIGKALGRIDEMMFRYYRGKANYLRSQADTVDQENASLQDMPWYAKMGYNMGTEAGITPDLNPLYGNGDALRQDAADADSKADEIKQNAIAVTAEQGRVAAGKLYTPGSYTTTPFSTGSVPEGTPKATRQHGNGGSGPAYAPDRQDQITKLWANHDVSHMLSEDKISADKYQEALAKLQVQQDLTGETSELDAKKFQLMTDRTQELAKETDALTKKRDEFQQKANDLVAGNADMVDALNDKKLSWASLGKDERKDFIHAYLGETADEKLAISFLDNVDKLTTKIADNNKVASGISGNLLKDKKSSESSAYNRNMQGINADEQLATYALGRDATDEEKRMVQLNAEVLKLAEAERRLQEIKNSDHSVEELKQQEVVVAGLKEKVLELKDVWKKFGEEAYDALDKILIQGDKISDVFKSLWKQLASDALHRLVTGKPSGDGGGLLGQALGLGEKVANNKAVDDKNSASKFFGIGSSLSALIDKQKSKEQTALVNGAGNGRSSGYYNVASGYQGANSNLLGLAGSEVSLLGGLFGGGGSSYDVTKGGGFFGLAPAFFANGGVTDGPSVAGEDGREIVIPIEKNTGNSKNLVSLAARHLGMSTPVVASVSKQTSEAAQNVVQSRDYTTTLEKQVALQEQTNQMLLHMINNGGNSGNTVAQPIVMQQGMSMDEFATMAQKAQAMRYTR
jgi:TP901 family phage tail tape measure protein